MYLKSIEIQGFKSFPDNTVINLSRGVTAIVGPNGSGKSNIVDAVKWVLGEQSSKNLRGGKMEDVIFGGTVKRPPSSYSKVSITIDNSERLLPIDYGEVTVTRRYGRNGDSEFFINRKSVRLKDIHELFMDTGLGRDGYSVIGQGRIDEILSIKSEDRREIFEEAAGITKFRYRKEEAEKRLSGTEENLVRIRDIASTLESSLEPMRQAAEKTKKYFALYEDAKKTEVSIWLSESGRLRERIKEISAEHTIADRNLSVRKSELDGIYDSIEKTGEKIRLKDREIESERQETALLESAAAEAEKQAAVCRSGMENTLETIKQAENRLKREGEQITELKNRLMELAEAEKEAKKQAEDIALKIEQLQKENSERENQSREHVKSVLSLQQEISDVITEEAKLREKRAFAQKELQEAESKLSELESKMGDSQKAAEQSEKRIAEIDRETESHRESMEQAQNVLSGFELLLQRQEKKLENLYEEGQSLSVKLKSSEERLNMLKAFEREHEGFSKAVKTVLKAAEKGQLHGILGTVSEIIKVNDDCAVAVEIALGGAMQNIVVENEQDGKKAIGYLKSCDGGRGTFLPVSLIRGRRADDIYKNENGYVGMACDLVEYDGRFDGIVKNLLGSTLVVQHIDAAIAIQKKHPGRVRIVTLDGQIISTHGAMTGGSLNRSVGVFSRKNEAERLEQEQKEQSERLGKLREEYLKVKDALGNMKFQKESAENTLSEAKLALSKLNAEKEGEQKLLEAVRGGESGYLAEKSSLDSKAQAAKESLSESEGQIEKNAARFETLNGQKENHQREIERLDTESALCREQTESLKAEKSKTEGRILYLAGTYEEISVLVSQLEKESLLSGENRKELENRLKDLKEQAEKQEKTLKELKEQGEKRRDKLQKLIEQKLAVEGEREKLQRQSQGKNNAVLNLERETARLLSLKEQTEGELQRILDKMWESYELTPMAAAEEYEKCADISESRAALARLKNDMKALGSVNVLAVEEYEKAFENYSFMKKQWDDLEKAKGDILTVIADLTKNMQETFASHFVMINDSFRATFKEIFGGGDACLRLEDENDILNCGIEIKVTLPGKTVKTISLLSGGEKAFVAIALYFAILKVRPTPFCILDEIEAALDDVNVVKYITYMKTLCESTQFIVITHRRGTMEGSDILYGVAMQETGVSKLLTINVNEAEEKLGLLNDNK